MKILTIYSTLTGNTKMVAEAISKHHNFDIINAKEFNDEMINIYDKIIVGGWIDKGDIDTLSQKIIDKIKEKIVGYFFTLGADPNSEHAKNIYQKIDDRFLKNNNKIENRFACMGKIDPRLTEKMKQNTNPHHPWDEKRKRTHEIASTHPDENDIQNAIKAFN